MGSRLTRAALLIASLHIAGCGTVSNLTRSRTEEGGTSPFGGVRHDLWCIQKSSNEEIGLRGHSKSASEHYPRTVLTLFCAADLPFSLIGDLLTWPYTKVYTFINQPTPVPPVVFANPPMVQALPTPPLMLPIPIPTPPTRNRSRAGVAGRVNDR